LLVVLARHLLPGASGDKSVAVPVETDEFDRIVDIIVARAVEVEPDSAPAVRAALEGLVESWSDAVEAGDVLQYARWAEQGPDVKGLMIPAGSSAMNTSTGEPLAAIFPPSEPPWPTLMSLRNVDRESTLKIISPKKNRKVADGGDH
jgi:hypothetical protein